MEQSSIRQEGDPEYPQRNHKSTLSRVFKLIRSPVPAWCFVGTITLPCFVRSLKFFHKNGLNCVSRLRGG